MKPKQPDQAVDLSQEDLDRVQGGGANSVPAGQGGPDLTNAEDQGPGRRQDTATVFPGSTKYPTIKLSRAAGSS